MTGRGGMADAINGGSGLRRGDGKGKFDLTRQLKSTVICLMK